MALLYTQKLKNQHAVLVLLLLINSIATVSSTCLADILYLYKSIYQYKIVIGPEESNELEVVLSPIPKKPEVCPIKDPKHHLEDFGYECPSKNIKELFISNDIPKIEPLDDNLLPIHPSQNTIEQFGAAFSFTTAVLVIPAILLIISIYFIIHCLYVRELRSLKSNVDEIMSKLNEQRDAFNETSYDYDYDDSEFDIEIPKTDLDLSFEKLKDGTPSSEKILSHLQKMVNKLKESHEEIDQHITTYFLQLLANYILENDSLEFYNLKLYTPELLLEHGKYYQKIKQRNADGDNSGNMTVNVKVVIDDEALNITPKEETDMSVTKEL